MSRYAVVLAVCLAAQAAWGGAPRPPSTPAGSGGGPTEQELDELRALEKDLKRYQSAAKDYQRTVDHMVKRAYLRRVKEATEKFEKQIRAEEEALKERRLEAIRVFEEFLKKHPKHPVHTPNAMFRLAELYYEKAYDDYLAATEPEPKADYDKVVALYRRLLVEFPSYRQNDAALYLLGYLLTTAEAKTKDEGRGRQAYLGLVCANKYDPLGEPAARERPKTQPKPSEPLGIQDPYADCEPRDAKSRYLPELWTRIGEDHFNVGELVLALYAFQKALSLKDHPEFQKHQENALYMLAWTYYNLDRFTEAIKFFDQVVVNADKAKQKGERTALLRPEAIAYIAISFAEPWEGDPPGGVPQKALQRFMAFYQGRDKEPHVREVYQKLAELWFDAGKAGNQEKLEAAATVYREMLKRWPEHRDNPKIQDQIVACMVYLRDQKRAIEEREKLAREYARGTSWYEKNRLDKEAVTEARRLAEGNMIEAALFHHKKAQELRERAEASRDEQLMAQAVEEYKIAGEHYQRFLEMYPTSKNVYEYSYSLADTYFFSFQFEKAAAQYRKVRDSTLDNRYYEEAATGVVLAHEKLVQLLLQKGELKKPPLPTPEAVKPPVTPQPIPEPYKRLQAEYDWYVKRFPKNPSTADRMYEAALISYRALDFPDARRRFEEILNRYCKESQHGIDAGNAILNTWLIEDGNTGTKVKEIEEWTNKLASMQCGAVAGKGYKPDPEMERRLKENKEAIARLKEALMLQKGEAAAKAGKWEEAAQYFETHIEMYKQSQHRLDSMKNLAVCYENLQRYGQATRVYERIFTEYADNAVEAPRAIWLAAAAYDRFFDFDRAVTLYKRLADTPKYARWKDPERSADMNRNEAILRAADICERDNNFLEAAKLYRRYADETRAQPTKKTAAALHRSAMQFVYMKNHQATIAAMNEFLKRYGGDRSAEVSGLAVEAYYRIAEAHEMLGHAKEAQKAYDRVVNEAKARGVKPGSLPAEYAAKAQFKLVEPKYQEFVAFKFVSSDDPKKAQRDLKLLNDKMKELAAEYSKVIAWNRPEWVTAAGYRTGELYRIGARKLLDAPPPPKIVKLDQRNPDAGIMAQYTEVMQSQAAPAEKAAQEQWEKVLAYAAKIPLSNEWTKLALSRLRDYQPDKYQAVRDERVDYLFDVREGR